MFGRRKSNPAPPDPEYIQIRSMYSNAFHVIAFADQDGPALCGSMSLVATNTILEANRDVILTGAPMQHAGWYWCSKCASILTGVDATAIAALRGVN